jgi:phage shock protein C
MNNDKKLKRSQNDRMIAGVCSGIGEYLDLDPTIVRLLFVLLFFLGGNGLLIYLILLIIMPVDTTSGIYENKSTPSDDSVE